MRYTYQTQGTCATEISFEINDGIISDVEFTGGCNGNLKAVRTLVEGMPVEKLLEKLSGITCGRRPTSCADQLAKAVEKVYNNS